MSQARRLRRKNPKMAEAMEHIRNQPSDEPKVMRVTYADDDVKEFTQYEWDCFGPGIKKNLVSKGLAKLCSISQS